MMQTRFQLFVTALVFAPLFACDRAPTAPADPPVAAEALTITSGSGQGNADLVLGDSIVITASYAKGSKFTDSAVTWEAVSGRHAIGIRPLTANTALIKTFAPGSATIQATGPGGVGLFAVGVRLPPEVPFVWTADEGMRALSLPPGVRYARVTAVNNRGEVVGSFRTSGGQQTFIWSKSTGFRAITEARLGENAVATAINNNGVVVGELSTEWEGSFMFTWSASEGFRPTGITGATPYAVNDAGQVVGKFYRYMDAFPAEQAFIWKIGASATTHLPGGSAATDINNLGNVVGYSAASGKGVAGISWEVAGAAPVEMFEPVDLMGCDIGSPTLWGSEEGCRGDAASVNDKGEAAGTKLNTAFRWTRGKPVDMLDLPGSRASWARAINANGDVVGHALVSPRNAPRPIHEAFVWRGTGQVDKLGTLPGTAISVAVAINDHGMIVGYAQ